VKALLISPFAQNIAPAERVNETQES